MKQLYYVIQTLLHGRGGNVIKVISLGLGLTISILLFSRVAYERSFDTCFREYDRICQVWSIFTVNGKQFDKQRQNCGPVAGAIMENFPKEVEAATTLVNWWNEPLFLGDNRYDVESGIVADSLFFQTLGIKVLSGNPVQELQQLRTAFLSQSMARRMFGDEDPVGKSFSQGHIRDVTVRGVFEDVPANTTIHPDVVYSMATLFAEEHFNYSWQGGDSWLQYVRLRPGADMEAVNSRMEAMIDKYRSDEDRKQYGYTAFLAPLTETYRQTDGVQMMTQVMFVLGLAILLIATLNYVLVSIASLSRRAKAIGVHKCSGASAGGIMGMFLLETLLIILASLGVMAVLLYVFSDFVEDVTSAPLHLLFAPERLWVPALVVGFLFVVGGVLPGRLFATIPVTQVFRRYVEGKKGWKRPLLFVQFAGVAFLCGVMCVVTAQYSYVMSGDLGYRAERVALGYATFSHQEREAAYQFFKGLPYVEEVSSANSTPPFGYSGAMIQADNGQSLFSARFCYFMREDYIKLMGFRFKQGRMAQKDDEIIVNETFAERMNWGDEVLGRTVNVEGGRFKVTGQLYDFRIGDFYDEPAPFAALYSPAFYGYLHLRLKEPFKKNLQQLNKAVAEAFPTRVIEFKGLEEMNARRYDSERIFRNAALLASVCMLFVMLMGLIGYTADEVHRRSKEIAIRKVNGAEALCILRLLTRDVLVVALPAVAIGSAAAWYVGRLWLDRFQVEIPLSWPVYLISALFVLVIIVACVVTKAWRIANENPVLSLKAE